ncbi:hypothetical protein RI367_000409 [Sorochytrium milnesiophthora]
MSPRPTALAILILSVLCAVLAQQQGDCLDVSASAQCPGIPNFVVPKDISGWAQQFLPPNTAQQTNMQNVSIFDGTFFALMLKFSDWTTNTVGCRIQTNMPRYFKSQMCASLSQFSATKCSATKPFALCAKFADEHYHSMEVAYDDPANNCPLANRDKLEAYVNAKLDPSVTTCVTPSSQSLENPDTLCGYMVPLTACQNGCTGSMAGAFENQSSKTCADLMQSKKVSAYGPLYVSNQSATALPGKAANATATGPPKSKPTTTSAPTSRHPVASSVTEENSSFFEKKILGLPGKFWVAIGGGVLLLIILVSAACIIRRRRQREVKLDRLRSMSASGYNTNPRGSISKSPLTSEFRNINSVPRSPTEPKPTRPRRPAYVDSYAAPATLASADPYQVNNAPPMPPSKNGSAGRPAPGKRVSSFVRQSVATVHDAHNSAPPRRAVISYLPRMDDELELHYGDEIVLYEVFGDGYGFGENLSAGGGRGREPVQGVFPIMCLDGEDSYDGGAAPPQSPQQPQSPGQQSVHYDTAGVRETMIQPNAQRFTQYTVASDFSDDEDDGRQFSRPGQYQPPMPQQQQQQRNNYQQQQPSSPHGGRRGR